MQNLSAPKTTASISLSMFAYLHSASVSALLAKAMGLLFCRSAMPRPTCEALTCMVTGSDGSKVSEGGVTDDNLLDSLKSSLVAGIPGEVGIFFQEFLQRSSQSGQAMDKGAEVCHHAEGTLGVQ